MTHLALKDELLDAQALRAVGAAPYGGADVGECPAVARRISGTDLGSWYDEWTRAADAVSALAEEAEAAGRRETARLAHLRACTYHRTAGVMLMGVPLDPRLVASNARQTDAFRRAAALMERRRPRSWRSPHTRRRRSGAHRPDRAQPGRPPGAACRQRGAPPRRCIADCGAFDMHAAAMARLPGPLAAGLQKGNRGATATVRELRSAPPRPSSSRP